MDELDIPEGCWDAPTIGDLQVGDLCERVPLAVLVSDRTDTFVDLDEQDLEFDESPLRRFVPFHYSFAIVIGHMTTYSVVAAVGTALDVPNEQYPRLVESGRSARSHLRLPPIPNDRWELWQGQEGVAFFSLIESFPTAALLPLRVAAMTEDARDVLQKRVSQAVSYD